MFTVGQKVWCVSFGPGTVTEVNNRPIERYSDIAVRFVRDNLVATFTPDGRPHVKADVCLFPYPVKVVRDDEHRKPSINWEHVDSKFNYLAEDANGDAFLYEKEPFSTMTAFRNGGGDVAEVFMFASYVKGTCDWKESLVKRPEGDSHDD